MHFSYAFESVMLAERQAELSTVLRILSVSLKNKNKNIRMITILTSTKF